MIALNSIRSACYSHHRKHDLTPQHPCFEKVPSELQQNLLVAKDCYVSIKHLPIQRNKKTLKKKLTMIKLKIKIPGVFVGNFEEISHLSVVLPLLT